MFIGVRDMLYARGRFMLIVSVIALMTFMVVVLSALTGGLKDQSVSAIERLPGSTLVLQQPAEGQEASLSQSTIDGAVPDGFSRLGISTTRLSAGDKSATASVFGADAPLMPAATDGAQPAPGEVLLSADTADDLGVSIGDTVTAGSLTLRVNGIGASGSYAHTPVVYTDVDTWRQLSHSTGVTALVSSHDTAAVHGTTAVPMSKADKAVPGYGSEHKSLLGMQVMLLAISALVIGAFFAVWTVQRLRDLAIVRAIGASPGYLLRDGIGQAFLVLVLGAGIGAGAGIGVASALSGVVPIALTVTGITLPLAAMAVLGTVGAALAVRKVSTVDPLVAMTR